MNFLRVKKILLVSLVGVLFCAVVPANVSAASSPKEGAKCSKAGAKVKVSKSVTLVCTKYGTKKKVLKWKRSVIVKTNPKAPAVTTTIPSSSTNTKIVIQGYAFKVGSGIKKGDELTISNLDAVTHTVTFDPYYVDVSIGGGYSIKKSKLVEAYNSKQFDVSIPGNASAKLPPLDVGSYGFYCTIHTSMRGKLIIG